jgi:hypothetical protein
MDQIDWPAKEDKTNRRASQGQSEDGQTIRQPITASRIITDDKIVVVYPGTVNDLEFRERIN